MDKELLRELRLTEDDFATIMSRIEGCSEEEIYVNLKAVQQRFGLNRWQLLNVARRTDIITSRENIKRLGEMQERFGYPNEAFKDVCDNRLDKFGLDIDFYDRVQQECWISNGEDMLSLIAYSSLHQGNLEPSEIMDNMAGILKYGVTKSMCCSKPYCLMFRPSQTSARMSFAWAGGYSPEETITRLVNIPNNILMARVVAEKMGLVPRGAMFEKTSEGYKQLTGVSNEELVKLVPVDRAEIVAFEQQFREKCPNVHNAFKSLGQKLVQFGEVDISMIKQSSPEVVADNMDVLHEKLHLDYDEILTIFKGKEIILSTNPELFLHNLVLVNRIVGALNTKNVVALNPQFLANASTDLIGNYKHFLEKYDMTPFEFGFIVSDASRVATKPVDEIDERSDALKAKYQLTDYDCGRLLANVPTSYSMPLWLLERKMDLAMAFGFTPKEVTRSGLLCMDINAMSDKIKLAMLSGVTKEEFLNLGNYRIPASRVYSRRRAMQNGEWRDGLSVYTSARFYAGVGMPIADDYYKEKYPFDSVGKSMLNYEFANEFPEIQERLEAYNKKRIEESLRGEQEEALNNIGIN